MREESVGGERHVRRAARPRQHIAASARRNSMARRAVSGTGGRRRRSYDQRTALPDQCLLSAEADVRPQGGSPGLDPKRT